MVCRGNLLLAYKDAKAAKAAPESYYKGEAPIDLRGATVEIATDYTKKKHVMRIKLSNSSEYLMQAKDDEEMKAWVDALRGVTAATGTSSRSQTLPAGDRKEEPKRRSFFTLKRT
jgi:spectrin beta